MSGNYSLTCCHVYPLKLPTASRFPLVSFYSVSASLLTLTKSFTHSLSSSCVLNKPLAQKEKEGGGERGGVRGGKVFYKRLDCQSYRLFCKLLTITNLTSFLHILLMLASGLNVSLVCLSLLWSPISMGIRYLPQDLEEEGMVQFFPAHISIICKAVSNHTDLSETLECTCNVSNPISIKERLQF